MKTTLILISILGMMSSTVMAQLQIAQEDLRTTCKVFYKLTNEAIDNDRKDLIAIYYNAYKAIRLNNEITEGCDQYFEGIKTNYSDDIGGWTVGLDFPPRNLGSPTTGGFTHKEVESLARFKILGLTIEDLDQIKLYKGIQENSVEVKLLKTTNIEKVMLLNENLNKLKMEDIDFQKLNSLSNENLKIEQFQKVIE